MGSETSLVAAQMRLQLWVEQIRDCQSRPSGMRVEDWCEQHGITKANYYYRLKRVRKTCLNACKETAFVEVPVTAAPAAPQLLGTETGIHDTAGVLHIPGGAFLEIRNNASAEFLKKLIGAARHVQ